MEVAAASRLNIDVPAVPNFDEPTMPGAAAMADSASKDPNVTLAPRRDCPSRVFVFMPLIAALLGSANFRGRVDRSADVDLGHQPAEVLGVDGQMIELGGVQVEFLALRESGCIQNHVDGFAT